MEILKKATLKNGTDIQIENWKDDYSFMEYGNTIAAYPTSKADLTEQFGQFAPKTNEKFRAQFDFKSNAEAEKIFEELKNEGKSLLDIKDNLLVEEYETCL